MAFVACVPRFASAGGLTGPGTTAPQTTIAPSEPTVDVSQYGDFFQATLGITGSSDQSANLESDAAPLQPRCTWAADQAQMAPDSGDTRVYWQHRVAGARPPQQADAPGPGTETFMIRTCGGQRVGMWVQSPEAVDWQMLISAATDRARGRIPLPSLNMSPAPEVGTVVNLGLWLAVNDPGRVQALTEIGPAWAMVTATFTGISWDMGNGDVVECSGTGTPYPVGSNQLEQGPCGYTYTKKPPLDGYTVTATSHWTLQLTTSNGRNEALAPMSTSHTFAYDVDEIVTVGEA